MGLIKRLTKTAALSDVRHLDKLDVLKLGPDDHIIGASGAAAYYGLPVVNDDLDIAVRPTRKLIGRMRKKLLPGANDGMHNHMLRDASGKLDVGTGGWFKFDEWYPKTELVNGKYRFLNKEGLKDFYKLLYSKYGKEKHLQRLKMLEKEA